MSNAPTRTTPHRVQDEKNLAWLDLEMTGLDVGRHVILQAALIITDAELNPLEEFCTDIWNPEATLGEMNPYVRQMHAKTGLTKRVGEAKWDLPRVEEMLLEIVSGWCPYGAVLCGNSIWQDRRFVDRYMPGLGTYLTYRMVDVSSLKILALQWYGKQALFAKPRGGEHDALVDIRNSIAELAHYRAQLFRSP